MGRVLPGAVRRRSLLRVLGVGLILLAAVPVRLDAGFVERISLTPTGEEFDRWATEPTISDDGLRVVFWVNYPAGGERELYLRDTTGEGTTVPIDFPPGAFPMWFGGERPYISGDGRFVAFDTTVDYVDGHYVNKVFVRDVDGQVTYPIEEGVDGALSDDENSRYVAFTSSEMLLPEDPTSFPDIYVYDRQTTALFLESVWTDDTYAHGSQGAPDLSADSRYLVFYSSAWNWPGPKSSRDLYLRDRDLGITTRITLAHDGGASNGTNWCGVVSADGRYVAFVSSASNLVPDDTNAADDVFIWDRETGGTVRASVSSGGEEANAERGNRACPAISSDGRYVVFDSDADNLVPDDTNGHGDIFLHDRLRRTTQRVSLAWDDSEADGPSYRPTISGNGRYVAFDSAATNLVPDDTNGELDVFRVDVELMNLLPRADFRWEVASSSAGGSRAVLPQPGDAVNFFDTSSGEITSWSWDFGDGSTSTQQNPSHSYGEARSYRVSLTVTNAYGGDSRSKWLYVALESGGEAVPRFIELNRQYQGAFLKGTRDATGASLKNDFTAEVFWPEDTIEPRVCFEVENPATGAITTHPEGLAVPPPASVTHQFDMVADFTPSFAASRLTVRPIDGADCASPEKEGIAGLNDVWVFPYPEWLQLVVDFPGEDEGLEFSIDGGDVKTRLRLKFPKPPLSKTVTIPDSVPYLAGQLGLDNTYGWIDASISSEKEGGSLSLGGQTTFQAMGQELTGWASGGGDFVLKPTSGGLGLTSATFELGLKGTLTKEMGVVEAIPQLAGLASYPGIKQFNQRAKLKGELEPSVSFISSFKQKAEEGTGEKKLVFNDFSTTLGLGAKVTLDVDLVPDVLTASPYVSGGGSLQVGVPATETQPFVRELKADLEVGMEFKVNYLLGTLTLTPKCPATCTWSPSSSVQCSDCRAGGGSGALAAADLGRLAPIQIDYQHFGPYSRLAARPLAASATAALPGDRSATSLFDNVFPGASPRLLEVGSDKLLLWVHQDPSDPVLQSTEIAWAMEDTTGWSTMALIADDTRVEIAPVAAVDASGKVVAAWLRVKSDDFTTPIGSFDELPTYFQEFEVVAAVFDPVLRTWSAITPLTDDSAFDSDLLLSTDGAGGLMLTWLSNAGGEMLSTAAAPSVLRFSLWDGTTATWGAPAAVATGLEGVSSHTAAYNGSTGLVILSRDPDLESVGDAVLEHWHWDGTSWSGPWAFASGGGDHHQPRAVYDAAGEGHVVWIGGEDLVKATVSASTPTTIRHGSASLAFYDTRFFTNPDGNLTLLWQEGVDNGPSNLFAMLYDPDSATWSKDGRLTAEEEVKHYSPSGYYGSDGFLRVAHLATAVERVETDVDIDGEIVTIPNIPQDGQTDLRLVEHQLIVDLAVGDEDIEVFPFLPRPGDEVTLTVRIHNEGDFATGSFDVEVHAGDPAAGGVLVGATTVDAPFVARDHVELEFVFLYPETGGDLYVLVDAADAVPESREANNRAAWGASSVSEDDEENNAGVCHLDNEPPMAVAVASVTAGLPPLTVDFDASASVDPEGEPLTFSWVFADGGPSAGGAEVSHTFFEIGRYPVVLAAKDEKGRVGSAAVEITVWDPLFPSCYVERDLVLTDLTVTCGWRYEACRSISAGDGFAVGAGGDVTLQAGHWVALGNGSHVDAGGRLEIVLD